MGKKEEQKSSCLIDHDGHAVPSILCRSVLGFATSNSPFGLLLDNDVPLLVQYSCVSTVRAMLLWDGTRMGLLGSSHKVIIGFPRQKSSFSRFEPHQTGKIVARSNTSDRSAPQTSKRRDGRR